jgi:hypothetical protein
MNQMALHLTDRVLPWAPMRHWVLTFPSPLPVRLLYDPELRGDILRIVVRAIGGHYHRSVDAAGADPLQTGAVTSIQLSNGSLQPFLHFHTLWLDGGYLPPTSDRPLSFRRAPRLTDAQLLAVVGHTAAGRGPQGPRVLRLLARKGLLDPEEAPDGPVPAALTWIPWGRPLKTGRRHQPRPPTVAPLCARSVAGFTLHARTRVPAHDRQALVRLVRYVTRPPLAIHRLTRTDDGLVVLHLPHPRKDGTVAFTYDPVDFIGLLAAIVLGPCGPVPLKVREAL